MKIVVNEENEIFGVYCITVCQIFVFALFARTVGADSNWTE